MGKYHVLLATVTCGFFGLGQALGNGTTIPDHEMDGYDHWFDIKPSRMDPSYLENEIFSLRLSHNSSNDRHIPLVAAPDFPPTGPYEVFGLMATNAQAHYNGSALIGGASGKIRAGWQSDRQAQKATMTMHLTPTRRITPGRGQDLSQYQSLKLTMRAPMVTGADVSVGAFVSHGPGSVSLGRPIPIIPDSQQRTYRLDVRPSAFFNQPPESQSQILSDVHMIGWTFYLDGKPANWEAGTHLDTFTFDMFGLDEAPPPVPEFDISNAILVQANINQTVSPGHNGDYNQDGFVGIDDIRIMEQNWTDDTTCATVIIGDANCDGQPSAKDLPILAENMWTFVEPFQDGDFNGDGFVDLEDVDWIELGFQMTRRDDDRDRATLLRSAPLAEFEAAEDKPEYPTTFDEFLRSQPDLPELPSHLVNDENVTFIPSGGPIPEPSSLAMLAVGSWLMLRRKR